MFRYLTSSSLNKLSNLRWHQTFHASINALERCETSKFLNLVVADSFVIVSSLLSSKYHELDDYLYPSSVSMPN